MITAGQQLEAGGPIIESQTKKRKRQLLSPRANIKKKMRRSCTQKQYESPSTSDRIEYVMCPSNFVSKPPVQVRNLRLEPFNPSPSSSSRPRTSSPYDFVDRKSPIRKFEHSKRFSEGPPAKMISPSPDEGMRGDEKKARRRGGRRSWRLKGSL